MTGIECLRAEMEKRGMNKQQQTSKVAAVVLDILSETGTAYTSVYDAEQTLENLKRQIASAKYTLSELRSELAGVNESVNYRRRVEEMKMEAEKEEIEEKRQQLQEYIEAFLKDMESCETPEGRDAMRQAQVYVNTVGEMVQSAYDRTAYINALGAIMTRGSFDCTVELKKINPKLFQGRK